MRVHYKPVEKSTKHTIKRTFRACVLIRAYEGIVSERNEWTVDDKFLILTTPDGDEIMIININELYDKLCRSGKHKTILTKIETDIYQKYLDNEKKV